jgi:hypothetical protein
MGHKITNKSLSPLKISLEISAIVYSAAPKKVCLFRHTSKTQGIGVGDRSRKMVLSRSLGVWSRLTQDCSCPYTGSPSYSHLHFLLGHFFVSVPMCALTHLCPRYPYIVHWRITLHYCLSDQRFLLSWERINKYLILSYLTSLQMPNIELHHPGIEPGPPLIVCGRSTIELWNLYVIRVCARQLTTREGSNLM